jgi:hypothetical protein
MVINTFLLRNPTLKISGVIFSAPFFGMSEHLQIDTFKVVMMKTLLPILEVSITTT